MDIVIKSWNAATLTQMAVDSIQKNTEIPFRIIIVDNGSDKHNRSILKNINGVEIIELKRNFGPGAAAVRGLKETKTDLVVMMDNDVVVQKGWLKKMKKYFNDPTVGLVSPLRYSTLAKYPNSETSSRFMWEKIKLSHSDPKIQLANFIGKSNTLENFRREYVIWNNIKDEEIIAPPGFVSSSCIMFNKKAVIKSGGISLPIFKKYGGEDVDLCWRLGKAGYKIIRAKDIYVHHFEHSSAIENNLDIDELLEESNTLLYNMWGNEVLSTERILIKKFSQKTINKKFPFIKVFKQIKKHARVKPF